jgi:hypothetical protein
LSRRTAVRLALLVVAAAAGAAALGSPRSTWQNDGLRVEHPPRRGVAALVAASALAAAGLSGRPRPAAAAALVAAAGLAALGAHRLWWRVEAVEGGLRERTMAGTRTIAWSDVERVEPRPDAVRLRARDGTEIAVGARGLAPEERTRLERTIARRLREAAR